jgi:hypothetical protein
MQLPTNSILACLKAIQIVTLVIDGLCLKKTRLESQNYWTTPDGELGIPHFYEAILVMGNTMVTLTNHGKMLSMFVTFDHVTVSSVEKLDT